MMILNFRWGGSFTPESKKVVSADHKRVGGKCGAVSVKWFPKKADHGEINDFLVKAGLPEGHEHVNIKDNGQVIISNLDSKICDNLCETITGSKFKAKKTVYCQGIVLATPEKSSGSSAQSPVQSTSTTDLPGKKASTISRPSPNKDDDYVFNDISQSKFFRKVDESESDDFDDDVENETKNWTVNGNKRKKKKMLTNSAAVKKVNNKTTPKLKR